MDKELRSSERSGDALRHAAQMRRLGRLEECADTLERAWLEGSDDCGNALFDLLDEWRTTNAVAVETRLDRLACKNNDRARRTWEKWFPDLAKLLGVSDNIRGLRRTLIEQVEKPWDSILILRGASGVGKQQAAHVFHRLTGGAEFRACTNFSGNDLPLGDPVPPDNGTYYVHAVGAGVWETRCVQSCRERHTRLVVGYVPHAGEEEGGRRWESLHALDHVDYSIASLDRRREDLPLLIVKGFPETILTNPPPGLEQVKAIHVQPEAVVELSRRSWAETNVRLLFTRLQNAAHRASRDSGNMETLTICVQHLPPE